MGASQSVKCLLCKEKELGSIPNPYKNLGPAHICNSPRLGDRNGRVSGICWPASLTKSVSLMFSETISQKGRWRVTDKDTRN